MQKAGFLITGLNFTAAYNAVHSKLSNIKKYTQRMVSCIVLGNIKKHAEGTINSKWHPAQTENMFSQNPSTMERDLEF